MTKAYPLASILAVLLLLWGGAAPARAPDASIWAEAQISEAKPYVQQTLIYMIMVVSKVALERVEHTPPSVSGAALERLDEQPLNYPFNMEGRRYNITAFRYAFTPLTLGEITIPKAQVKVVTGTRPFAWPGTAGATPLELETNTIHLEIQPPVASGQKSWLPLTMLKISGDLKKPASSQVGDPITLTLTLDAHGAAGVQLPSLERMLQSEAFKLYPERPQTSKEVVPDGSVLILSGRRVETYTLIPQQSGELQLPPLQIHWWDVRKQKAKVAEWKAPTIRIGADGSAPGEGMEALKNPLSTANLYFWAVVGAIAVFVIGWWTGKGYPGGDTLRRWLKEIGAALWSRLVRWRRRGAVQVRRQWDQAGTTMTRYLPAGLAQKGAALWLRDALIPRSLHMFFSLRRMDTCDDAASCAEHLQDFAHTYLGLRRREALPKIGRALYATYPDLDKLAAQNLCSDLETALYAPGGEQAAHFNVEIWKDDFRGLCQLLPFHTPRLRAVQGSGRLPPLNPEPVAEV